MPVTYGQLENGQVTVTTLLNYHVKKLKTNKNEKIYFKHKQKRKTQE